MHKRCNFIANTLKLRIFYINTLRPRKNGRHFPDNIFKWIFLNENVWISIEISLTFAPKYPITYYIPPSLRIMAWHWPGDNLAIIWNNDGIIYWRIYASLGLNELKSSKWFGWYLMSTWQTILRFWQSGCCVIHILPVIKDEITLAVYIYLFFV